jgi:hypothetical protein
MKEIHTEIIINAPANKVWKLLTDFEKYPGWNPFIVKIEGMPRKGEKIKVYLRSAMTRINFNATIINTEPGRELRWVGHLFFPGLLDGEHIFIIEPIGKNKIRFTHSERFTGLLSFLGGLNKLTRSGLNDMNRDLKACAEKAW